MVDRSYAFGYTRAKLEHLAGIVRQLKDTRIELTREMIVAMEKKSIDLSVEIYDALSKTDQIRHTDELRYTCRELMDTIAAHADLRRDALRGRTRRAVGTEVDDLPARVVLVADPVPPQPLIFDPVIPEPSVEEELAIAGLNRTRRAYIPSPSVEPNRQMEEPNRQVEEQNRPDNIVQPASVRSEVHIPESEQHRIMLNVEPIRPRAMREERARPPLPPFADRCPIELRCSSDLIGLTEVFVRRPSSSSVVECPECSENHPLYACPYMLRASLAERWHTALDLGVCLNCLRYGHSSYTCRIAGNCKHCEVAHNSVLCPVIHARRT